MIIILKNEARVVIIYSAQLSQIEIKIPFLRVVNAGSSILTREFAFITKKC